MSVSQQLIDPAEIRRGLRATTVCGQVIEVRVLNALTKTDRWPSTCSGFFNNCEAVIEALPDILSATGFYFTPNPVHPALLSRCMNRLKRTGKGDATADHDIVKRRWLLIDCDPVKPTGISTTDTEHEAALSRARDIRRYMVNLGCPEPIFADSGNGAHLLFRQDLHTADEGMVQQQLIRLAKEFDDERVIVDTKVFNPARIWKLYGTLACKGDNTPERPHRMSRILSTPGETEVR